MIFPTVQFAAFFAVVLPLSWALMPRPRLWKPFILLASYVFYGYADWRFCLLLAASTLVNQAAAIGAAAARRDGAESRRRAWVTAAVVIDLGLLGVFKYLDFLVGSVDSALDSVGLGVPLPVLQIALPVGISFFTFQAISYVVDVGRGKADLASWVDFAVYEAFFPHLVAGPIVRAREFLPQLRTPRDPRSVPTVAALFLVAGGLFKKVVLADLIATRLVDPVFDSPAHSGGETLLAIYGYAAQIYCDFSAYTDIAIGVALLLGFRFPQNFDRPYAATSLQSFWRRWHMSLSRWLRDYLYIGLGGSRRGRRRTYVNLALTMVLGGLWHGASWTFVAWGAVHGGGLAVERWWRERRARRAAEGGGAPTEGDLRTGAAPSAGPAPALPPFGGAAGSRSRFPAAGMPVPVAADGREAVRATTLVADGTSAAPGTTVLPQPRREAAPRPARFRRAAAAALGWLVTFHVVCLAWVLFRAPDFGGAVAVLSRLGSWGPAPLVTPAVLAAVAAGLGTQFVPARFWARVQRGFAVLPLVVQALLLAGFLVLVDAIVGNQGVAPFIYFRF